MSNILNDFDNKTNLLFKQFQGKAQSNIATSSTGPNAPVGFQNEPVKGLKMVFQEEIMAETVPTNLPSGKSIPALFSDSSVPDSSWNNNIWDQTKSATTIVDSSGQNLPLTFYKRLYLNPVLLNKSRAWWLLDSSSADPIPENNILKYTIPFGYNGVNASEYTPIVEYFDSAANGYQQASQGASSGLNWLMDPATGILQFYQTDSIINSNGINANNLAITNDKLRPRISFIKYAGQFGTGSSGSGGSGNGLVKVGELSGNTVGSSQDVSAIYFDKEAFDISLVDQTAKITFVGTGSAKVSDLSYYFFDVPNDLSGTGDLSMGNPFGSPSQSFICLSLILPSQTKSAVPFGNSKQYGNPAANPANEADLPIKYLPFFDELKVQYKDWTVNTDPAQGWTDLSINNSSPYRQTHIPPTITRLNLGAKGTGTDTANLKDKSGNLNNLNPPFITYNNNVQLEIGKVYQFRLFLTNNGEEPGIVDPLYGGDVSFNYLYIPGISGEGISLGSFGSATAPTQIFFSPAELTNFTLKGFNDDPSGADQSGNVPFNNTNGILPGLNYEVFYGFDLSQNPLSNAQGAKQMPEYRNLIPEANFTYETTPSTRFKDWQAPNTTISSESVYPETKYQAFNYYMRNNVQDFSGVKSYARDSSHLVPPADPSYTTPFPTRSQASAQTDRMQSTTLSFSETSGIPTTPAIPINGTLAQDIYFLKDLSNAEFDIGNLPAPFANNSQSNQVGIDSSGVELTSLKIKTEDNSGVLHHATTNATKGYLDVSNISISTGNTNFFTLDATSSEGGSAPKTQKGYYTDISINTAKLLDVSLGSYPDICNNNYHKYTVKITDTYNGGVGPGPFLTGNDASGEIGIARKPGQINYSLNNYTNPIVSLDRDFFGLKMPDLRTTATDITLDYSYNLQNIALWWKPNTTNISTSSAVYDPSGSGRYKIDTKNKVWPLGSQVPSIDVIPNNQIRREVWTSNTSSWNGGVRAYSRDAADIDFSGCQFGIETKYNDNVTYWTSDYTENAPFQDVSFGNPGKYLWWDSTWDNTNNIQPSNKPNGFFNTNLAANIDFIQAIGNSGWNTAGLYNESDDLTSVGYGNKQLIWANRGFRPAGTSGKNNPYVDFTSYYNPGSVLKNYSPLGISGEIVSKVYDGANGNLQWWDNNINPPPTTAITRTLKYISFNIDMPFIDVIPNVGTSPNATNYIFQIEITNHQKDNSTSGIGSGYWVFHNENDNAGTVGGPFDGQGQYNSLGTGSFILQYDGYRIRNPSSNTSLNLKTTLQISIGFPNNLSDSIEDVTIKFLKY